MADGLGQDAEQDVLLRVDFRGEFAGEKLGKLLVDDQHDAVGEEEDAHGFHAEEEVVVSRIVLRVLEDDGDVVVFELDTRRLVRVDGGRQRVRIDPQFVGQIGAFLPVGHHVDVDGDRACVGMGDAAV